MKKVLLLAFVALMAMTGCKKQSELTIDAISGKATLTGSVYYKPGWKISRKDGRVELDKVPAANQKLVVVVAYSKYQSNAQGDKYYETTIDKDGNFSVTIPVPATKSLSNYKIRLRPFQAEYTDIETNEDRKEEEVDKIAYFDEISLITPELYNGDTYYVGEAILKYTKLIDIEK